MPRKEGEKMQNITIETAVTPFNRPVFSLNIPIVDELFPGFLTGDFAVINGSSSALTSLLCVRAQLPTQIGGLCSSVVFIDGGITFRLYNIARLAQLHQMNPEKVLGRIFISRAFTAYQLTALIMERLEETVKSYDAKIVLISDIAGMTLPKALEKVVANKMVSGPLAVEVNQLIVQMSWGTSFEDALTNFKNKINSPIVNRFCVLVLEASRSGGTIKKVFTATSGFMEEMKEIDRDTSAQMKPYIIVIYSAFAVFIVTAILLVNSFFAPLEGSADVLNSLSAGAGSSDFRGFFYQFMIMSALTGVLMAGKIGERRLAGGMKHSILLLVAGYVIFFATIPPSWV